MEDVDLGEKKGGMGYGGRPWAVLPLPLLLLFFGAFVAKDLALKNGLSKGPYLESC